MKMLIIILLSTFSMSAMAQQSNTQLLPIKKDDGVQNNITDTVNRAQQRPPIKAGGRSILTPRQANSNAPGTNARAKRPPIKTSQGPAAENAGVQGNAKTPSQQKPIQTPSSISVTKAQAAMQKQQQATPVPRQSPPAKQ